MHSGVPALQSAAVSPAHRWLVARRLRDGKEAWRVELPARADPTPIEKVGRSYLVRDQQFAWFFHATGTVTIKLAEKLIHAHPTGDDWILSTDKRIARLDSHGIERWRVPPTARSSRCSARKRA